MNQQSLDLREFHWLMDVMQSMDIGLLVVDEAYSIQVWNGFMANHSGVRPEKVIGSNLFDSFSDIPRDWFVRKADTVRLLRGRAFTTWEQRPYLFKFKNYRPITGSVEFMYQNITFIPLSSADGRVTHIGVLIYDVTDVVTSKLELEKARQPPVT